MTVVQISWESLDAGDASSHVARHTRFPRSSPLHTHDFAEVFWVEAGAAVHEVDGTEHRLRGGDVVVVRPEAIHRFRAPSDDFALTNVAFRREILADLHDRYHPESLPPWENSGPLGLTRTAAELARLGELAAVLAASGSTRLDLDRLLIEVLAGGVAARSPGPMPLWLADAFTRWGDDPEALAAGVAGLAAVAGRSQEHVSRTIRKATGRKAIDTVNDIRIERAAVRLRMTDDGIGHVAADVGLANLSHFYRVFRRRFGTTPRRYRLTHRRVIEPSLRSAP